MAWIESHVELPTHPKTRKAARLLDATIPTVIGHLHVLWYWCLTHRPDGELAGMDAYDIADAAAWDGEPHRLVDALELAGWLDRDGDQYTVHDWWEGAGKTVARRKFATERQRRARERAAGDRDVSASHALVTRDTRVSHVADSDSDRDKEERVSSRKRADRATRIADGWTPRPEPDLVQAVGGQRQADRELDRFRDYWTAQPGAKGRKVDWQATWRNWLRRAADNRRTSGSTDPPRPRALVVGSPEWEAQQAQQRQLEERLLGGA